MNSELRQALRRLCSGAGWSYAVLWRVDPRKSRLLIMETNYCEEKFRAVMAKMVDEVHIVGEGTIGEVAASGEHQWMHSDGNTTKWSRTGTSVDRDISQDKTEWCYQFLFGIKSMVFISLPSQAVVQFGSSQQMFEDLGFINQVQSSFQQLNGVKGPSLIEDAQHDAKLHMQHGELETAVASEDFYTWYKNINSMYGSHNDKLMKNVQLSRGRLKSSTNHFSEEFHPSSRFITGLQHPNVVAMSSTSCAAYATQRFTNDGVLASRYSQMTAHDHCDRDLNNQHGTLDIVNASSEICKTNSYGAEKLCSFEHASSSCHIIESDLLTNNDLIKTISFGSEQLGSMHSIQRDSPLAVSSLVCSKDDNQGENSLVDQQLEQRSKKHALLAHGNKPEAVSTSCSSADNNPCGLMTQFSSVAANSSAESASNFFSVEHNVTENTLNTVSTLLADNDFFDNMELALNPSVFGQDSWDDIMIPINKVGEMNISSSKSECILDWDMSFKADTGENIFSESGVELLDAIVCGNHNLASSHGSVDTKINHITNSHSENWCSTSEHVVGAQPYIHEVPSVDLPCFSQTSDLLLSGCSFGNKHGSLKEAEPKSRHSACSDDNNSMNAASSVINSPKISEEAPKVVRRRARPGESTRPRPKDRQQIQDRVRELRELVPNGAKCSIDALLDRTIKHMLYLQGVTKYADKIKQADESKVICEENSVVLRDTTGSNGNGATWAFEIAGRTMVCPIIVEDLSPPGQMLVEMLCEECGFFLEIADVIRGFGLIILKGVMEVRNTKIWARFFVEANRNVTRMDIFLSLVQLLQQAASGTRAIDQINNAIDSKARDLTHFQQPHMAIPISLSNKLQ